jgi:DNA-binding HxlR family transcriptional regulator
MQRVRRPKKNDPTASPFFDAVQGRWRPLILAALRNGVRRPGELRRALPGISKMQLCRDLHVLASRGILVKQSWDETVPRVEYSLSAKGAALYPILDAVTAWGARYGRTQSI